MPDSPRFGPEDPADLARQRRRDARNQRGAVGTGDEESETFVADPPKRGCMRSCFTGCLWTTLVLAVLGGIAGFWIYRHWRDWVSDVGAQAAKQGIEASDLPEQEKDEIGVQIDRLAQAFRDKQLTAEQLADIVRKLADSPLATSLIVAAVEAKYINGSGLAEAERDEGRRELRRFARGVLDNKIPEDERDAVLANVADRDANDNWELRDRVSDDDLRKLIAAAKAAADTAQIVEEPEVVDPSEEFKRIVDEALAQPPQGGAP